MINRIDHVQTGAILAFDILTRMEMPPEEIATIVSSIGNHDEGHRSTDKYNVSSIDISR